MLVEVVATKEIKEVIKTEDGRLLLRIEDPIGDGERMPLMIRTFPDATPTDRPTKNADLLYWRVLSVDAKGRMELG